MQQSQSESGIKLVPFYRGEQSISHLDPEVAIDGELNEIKVYKDKKDLLLSSDKPLMLKLENFYDQPERWQNLTINFSQQQDRLNSQQLFELAKLAINYQDEIKDTYYDNVKEYTVRASNTTMNHSKTIYHNQKFINGSLTTVEPNDKRVGVLVIKGPDSLKMKALEDNNDLVFFVAQFNATIVMKNWNNKDHRISAVRHGEIEIKGLDRFSLSQVPEIQSLINKVKLQYIANQKLGELDKDIVNGIRYLLSIKGVERGIDSHRVLYFESGRDQEQFIAAYQNKYNGTNLAGYNRTSEAVVWQIVRGYHNLPYGDERQLLSKTKEVFSPIVGERIVSEVIESTNTDDLDSVAANIESYVENENLAEEITNVIAGQERRSGRKRREVESKEKEVFFNDAINLPLNDQVANSANKPSSWIGDIVSWVKGKLLNEQGLFYAQSYANIGLKGQQQEESTNQFSTEASIQNIDVNGAIMLLDVLIRKVTGQKFVFSENQPISMLEAQSYALNITEEFSKAISSGIDRPAEELVDLAEMQSKIFKTVMSGSGSKVPGILCSYATSTIGPEKAQALLSTLQTPTRASGKSEEKSNHNLPFYEARPRSCLSNVAIDNPGTKLVGRC